MMSHLPVNLKKVEQSELEKEILRAGIIAELDAVSLYEQLASITANRHIKRVLLDIAKEEKTHVGEFQALLLALDKQQKTELAKGSQEVKDLIRIKAMK